GTGRGGAGAVLDRVANTRRGATRCRRAHEAVGRTGRARAVTHLLYVAYARGRAADLPGRAEETGRRAARRRGAVRGGLVALLSRTISPGDGVRLRIATGGHVERQIHVRSVAATRPAAAGTARRGRAEKRIRRLPVA